MALEILRRSHLTFIVLGILREGPLHGYGISKVVKERSGGQNELKNGALYPLLHQLEEYGIVEGYEVPGPQGRQRRMYTLTEKGEQVFAEELDAYKQVGRIVGVLS